MIHAAIYCRVSTDRQAREGLSLQAQERACRDYAAEHGLDVGEVYIEAHSASEDYRERPELGRLLDASRQGRFDAVVFFDPDRMTRKRAHRWMLDEIFRELGIARLFVTSAYDDTLEGQLLADIHAYVAEKEIEKKRTQIRNSYRERMLSGKLLMQGSDRFGYRRNPDTGKRDIYEPEAIIVRRIFRLYADGVSTRRIARLLQDEGVPCPATGRYTYKDGRPVVWRHSAVSRIIASPEYRGQTYGWRRKSKGTNKGTTPRPQEEWIEIPDATPAIVDDDLWLAAQQRLEDGAIASANTRNGRENNAALLRGMIRCWQCGATMHVDNSHGRRIYRCSSREDSGGLCGGKYVRADQIEPFVWDCVTDALTDHELVERALAEHVERADASPYASDKQRIERALAGNRKEQERHIRRLRNMDDADIEQLIFRDLTTLRGDERVLNDELEVINERMAAQQAALSHMVQLSAYVERVAANLERFDFDDQRRTLMALGVEVFASGSNTARSAAQWEIRAMIPIDGVVSDSRNRMSRLPASLCRGWCVGLAYLARR